MQHQVSVVVDAAPEQVWAVLADVEHWPSWTPTMTSVRRLDGGPFGADSAVEVRQPKLPRNVWRVTRFEPGRRFEWASRAPGVTTRADHRIEPLEGDRSRVTLAIELSGALAPLLTMVVWSITRRYVNLEAHSLKRRCESHRADPTISS